MSRARKDADERRVCRGLRLSQKLLDRAAVLLAHGQTRHARNFSDAERREHVEVSVYGVLLSVFDGRRRLEVCEVVERARGPSRVEASVRAGEEAEQVRLREAVQVYDEIELAPTHVEHELPDLPDGEMLRPVAQAHAVNRERLVRDARHLHDRRGSAADRDRHARARKLLPNGSERGQAQDNVAQLAEVYDEYVARVETHRSD